MAEAPATIRPEEQADRETVRRVNELAFGCSCATFPRSPRSGSASAAPAPASPPPGQHDRAGVDSLLPRWRFHGLEYDLWLGLATSTSMGYGTCSAMPMPYSHDLARFFAALVEGVVG